MKILKTLYSYKEVLILIFILIYFITKRYPIQLIVMGTIALGICLYVGKFCIDRLISKNEELLETYKMRNDAANENTSYKSSTLEESKFREEIRVLRKVIEYAQACSRFYHYNELEAENYIDDRCKPFIDLVTPILAVSPNEYQLVINSRPSIEPYVKNRIKEYYEKKPDLQVLETEFRNIYNEMNVNLNNAKSGFNVNNAMCVIIMINKYGFSQELLLVAQRINTELTNAIMLLYDQRLKEVESYYDISYESYKNPEHAKYLR